MDTSFDIARLFALLSSCLIRHKYLLFFFFRRFHFEGDELILLVNSPHSSQIAKGKIMVWEACSPHLTFRLGCRVVLELPSSERLRGFIAGIVGAEGHRYRLALVVAMDGYLEVVHLISFPRRLAPLDFASLLIWSEGPRWAFLPLRHLGRHCRYLFAYTADPQTVWAQFVRRWYPLLRRYQEQRISPSELMVLANASVGPFW